MVAYPNSSPLISGVARVNKVGGAKEGGGLGAKPPGKFLGPRPLLWRRTHLLISYSPLAIRKLFIILWQLLYELKHEENFLKKSPLTWRRMHPLIPYLPMLNWKV